MDVIDYIEWMENIHWNSHPLMEGMKLIERAGEDLGLKFEYDLMDEERYCRTSASSALWISFRDAGQSLQR